MQGCFSITENFDPRKPHQGSGRHGFVRFENFPELQIGDQTGFQTLDGKIDCFGIIVHARTFSGINSGGGEEWDIHCHIYTMNAGFPAIPWETFEKLARRRNRIPVIPRKI
jgi:hypothetical protein